LFTLLLSICGDKNRPYRDANCGSARPLTLPSVELTTVTSGTATTTSSSSSSASHTNELTPTPSCTTNVNMALEYLDHPDAQGDDDNLNNNVLSNSRNANSGLLSSNNVRHNETSSVLNINRPITRSLSRLAAPKETHSPCPRTLRTKNRNYLLSSPTERHAPLPGQMVDKAGNNGSSSFVDHSSCVSNIGSNSNINSRLHSTRSSARLQSVPCKLGSSIGIGSSAARNHYAASSTSKSSSLYRSSVIVNKSPAYK